VGKEISAQLDKAPNPEDYRALATELNPYVSDWYAKWEIPPLQPHAIFNSRI
jgi:hypothetical protein